MSITRYANPTLRAKLLEGHTPQWLARRKRGRYIITATISTPYWVDRSLLYLLRDCARLMTLAMGVEYVLDHIVPLSSPVVCGLTVPWNLQIVPRTMNGAKSNHRWPDSPMDTLPLFPELMDGN